MNTIVRLTNLNGTPCFIGTRYIKSLGQRKASDWYQICGQRYDATPFFTAVHIEDGNVVYVRETPEEVQAAVNHEAQYRWNNG